MMAVCEVGLPRSVANPITFSRFSVAVSDGARSLATTMQGSVELAQRARRCAPRGCAGCGGPRRARPRRARAGSRPPAAASACGVAVGHRAQHRLDVLALARSSPRMTSSTNDAVVHAPAGARRRCWRSPGRCASLDLLLDLVDLAARGDQRLLEAGDLARDLRLGDLALDERGPRRWSPGTPGPTTTPGDTPMPLQLDLRRLPCRLVRPSAVNPRRTCCSTSSCSASSASSASGPVGRDLQHRALRCPPASSAP